ncbi:MAG: NUDIX hydrolase, partial [Anaerolineae bacterium]|nr:NUDIX hydrolase [Anaerolineae bacterium]
LVDAPPWLRVVQEAVRLEDYRTVIPDFFAVELQPHVIIFPLLEDGRVPLVEHYRHALRRVVRELPAGGIAPGEDPLECARRELLEETGIEVKTWVPLGAFCLDPNKGCGEAHVYLALDGRQITAPDPGDLALQVLHWYSQDEVRHLWQNGGFDSLSSVAAAGLAFAWLDAHRPSA